MAHPPLYFLEVFFGNVLLVILLIGRPTFARCSCSGTLHFHLYTVAQLFSLDEFTIGVWKDVSHIQDPSLVSLASSLPRVVLNAKARNTTVRYAYGWNRWKTWYKSQIVVTYIPAHQPMFVALYLRHLLNSAKTISPIDTAVYSIRWGHSLAGLPSPTEHPLVQSTYEGCKRILARPRASTRAGFSIPQLETLSKRTWESFSRI